MSQSCPKAVVRTESRSLTEHYGEKRAESGHSGDIFSGLSRRLKLADSGRQPRGLRVPWLYRVLLIALAGGLQTVAYSQANRRASLAGSDSSEQGVHQDVVELESAFISSDPSLYQAVHTSTDLPQRVRAAVQRQVPYGNLVQRGERWNTGDIISEDRPMAEHVISWISDTTALVVYRTGGWGVVTNLLLFDSTVATYCVYGGHNRALAAQLRLFEAQQLLSSLPDDAQRRCLPRDIAFDDKE